MLRGNLSSKALYEFLTFGNPHFNNIINKLFLGQQYHLSYQLKGWNELMKLLAAYRLSYVFIQWFCFEFQKAHLTSDV